MSIADIIDLVMKATPEQLADPDFGRADGKPAIYKEGRDTPEHPKVMAALQIRQAVEQIGSARMANKLLRGYTLLTFVIAIATALNVGIEIWRVCQGR